MADRAPFSTPEKYLLSLWPKILHLDFWFSRKRHNISILLKSQSKQAVHIKRLMGMLFGLVCFAPHKTRTKLQSKNPFVIALFQEVVWEIGKGKVKKNGHHKGGARREMWHAHTKCPKFPLEGYFSGLWNIHISLQIPLKTS